MIEEVINRGYLFQTLCEGIGKVKAAVIISLIFSVIHIFNPDFSIMAGVFLFVHGLLYAVAYLKTRSLWTPIGLHMAWNLAQGSIAGAKVSGTSVSKSLFLSEISGPEVLTGGSFGVEGGLIAILVSIIILFLLIRSKWLRPSERFILLERAAERNDAEQVSTGADE
jgi:membrane protease YdiL (CAAX protease family)